VARPSERRSDVERDDLLRVLRSGHRVAEMLLTASWIECSGDQDFARQILLGLPRRRSRCGTA
jgi:hypothetical protein